jgi:hypothetical protein
LHWGRRTESNAVEGIQRRSIMGEIVTKNLRQALNDPRVRYRLVDAWRKRTANELHRATEDSAQTSPSNKPIVRKSEAPSSR